jgi:hypothetical protein
MARFDPMAYPDRLAFEANARRIRAEELDKIVDAAAAWLDGRRQKLTDYLKKFSTAASTPAHRHSMR